MPRSLNYKTLQDRKRVIWGRNEISADVLLLDEAKFMVPQFTARLPVSDIPNNLRLNHAFRWLSHNITRGAFLWLDPEPPLTRHVQVYIERANDAELFRMKAGHIFAYAPTADFQGIAKLKARAACVKVYDREGMARWLAGNARENPAPFPLEREIKRYVF